MFYNEFVTSLVPLFSNKTIISRILSVHLYVPYLFSQDTTYMVVSTSRNISQRKLYSGSYLTLSLPQPPLNSIKKFLLFYTPVFVIYC